MKTVALITILSSLLVPSVPLLYSDAFGACTVEQRITLGNQGYNKDQVNRVCSGSAGIDNIFEQVLEGLGKGLGNELTKALGGGGSNARPLQEPPSANGATMCQTNYGACPLSGGPISYRCYCRAWNGTTFVGISR